MYFNTLTRHALLAASVFVLASCNKDKEEPGLQQTISDPTTVVSSLNISKIITDGEEKIFSYDEQGRLLKVASDYNYATETESGSGTEAYVFGYENNKLTTISLQAASEYTYNGTSSQSSYSAESTFSYNSDGLVSGIEKKREENWGGNTYNDTFTLTYSYSDGKLAKVDDNAGEYVAFSWNGHNVAKEQWFYTSNAGARLKNSPGARRKTSALQRFSHINSGLESEFIYSDFDDKQNPLMIFSLIYGYADGILISKNNAKKVISYYSDGESMVEDEKMTISHTYDDQGRPTVFNIRYESEGEVDEDEITIVYNN